LNNKGNFASQKVRLRIVLLLLLVGAPLFFLGGPGAHGSRSFIALWDLGHVLFFFLASWLFCRVFRYSFTKTSVLTFQVYVFLLVFITGISVEGLQMYFDGRSPDVHDILRNQLGCLITLAFFASGKRKLAGNILFPFRVTVVILILAAMFPLGRAVIDEQIALRQFPVLADFETPFEIDRWNKKELLSISDDVARNGKYSLKVRLTTDTYSGAELVYFPGTWKPYKNLYISVYVPEKSGLMLVCRVNDSVHNDEHSDRFNGRFFLKKGWNDLVIALEDIKNAPVKRLLNMNKIENLKLFVIRQDRARIIYIDHIYLEK